MFYSKTCTKHYELFEMCILCVSDQTNITWLMTKPSTYVHANGRKWTQSTHAFSSWIVECRLHLPYSGWYESNWWQVPDDSIDCSVEQMKEATNSHFGYIFESSPTDSNRKPTVSGMVRNRQEKGCQNNVQHHDKAQYRHDFHHDKRTSNRACMECFS